jgi:hypothetical protein
MSPLYQRRHLQIVARESHAFASVDLHLWRRFFAFPHAGVCMPAENLLSINAAALWLKARGVRPATRHAIYLAIARRRLRVAASASRVVLIRERDLAKYADEIGRPQ